MQANQHPGPHDFSTVCIDSNPTQQHLRMSDTCIVCLGDLSNSTGEVAALPITIAKSPPLNPAAAISKTADTDHSNNATHVASDAGNELIAHLRPCGHYLHNECLTPWVERANSCPICRASFHLVDLMYTINGESLRFRAHLTDRLAN